jgi:hypothetical protein
MQISDRPINKPVPDIPEAIEQIYLFIYNSRIFFGLLRNTFRFTPEFALFARVDFYLMRMTVRSI